MTDRRALTVSSLTALVATIFQDAGCDAAEAGRIAANLVEANQTGHDSHGVVRVPLYLDWLERGVVRAGERVTVLQETDSWLHLDGNHGFGQSVGPEAIALGIDQARRHGLCLVSLKRAGHLGRIGAFAETACAAGLASVHFVNVCGSELVAPYGAAERRLSTAPFCVGLPNDRDAPFILDFATSTIAEGKALAALRGGKPIPPGALVGPDGALTEDPATLYGDTGGSNRPDPTVGPGALTAMGLHKGSGLALACELLAGAITGSGTSGPDGRRAHNGLLALIFDPLKVGEGEGWSGIAQTFLDWVKEARPRDPAEPILLPGEPERRQRAARDAGGIPLPVLTLEGILAAAQARGQDRAALEALLADA